MQACGVASSGSANSSWRAPSTRAHRTRPHKPATARHGRTGDTMAIRSDEITTILKSEIDAFDAATETRSVGTVVEVGDGIAHIYGLDGALASELLEFPGGVRGMALNLEEETVGAVILGDARAIKEGDTVKTTGRVVEIPVGQALLGRVVDPLGRPLDDKGPINATKTRPVERIAPGVIVRQSVDTPVQTGIKAIDALIPIGR